MTDLLGGRISMMFDTTSNFVEHVKTGKVRALGVTGRKRSPAMPSVPTISETPACREYDMTLWLGVLAPAGTPKDVVTRLHARHRRGDGRRRSSVKQMADAGIEVRTSTPEEFAALIRADMAKWAAVVKKSGLQPESGRSKSWHPRPSRAIVVLDLSRVLSGAVLHDDAARPGRAR